MAGQTEQAALNRYMRMDSTEREARILMALDYQNHLLEELRQSLEDRG